MPLPFDLEDIVGVALADILRRVGMIAACVLGAPFLVAFSVASVYALGDLDFGYFGEMLLAAPLLFLLPVMSVWGILYVPTLIAACFYFTKSESPAARAYVVFTAILAALILCAADEWEWGLIFVVLIIAGVLGSILWFARWWENKQRVEGEQHFMALTIENEQRRQAMRDKFGIDVADRDFVVDESPDDDSEETRR